MEYIIGYAVVVVYSLIILGALASLSALWIIHNTRNNFIACWLYAHIMDLELGKKYDHVIKSNNVISMSFDEWYIRAKDMNGYDPSAVYCLDNRAFVKEGYGDDISINGHLKSTDDILIADGEISHLLFVHLYKKKFGVNIEEIVEKIL